jgi:hypothetical protein
MIQWFHEMLWTVKIKGAVDTKDVIISSIFWSDVIVFVHLFIFSFIIHLSLVNFLTSSPFVLSQYLTALIRQFVLTKITCMAVPIHSTVWFFESPFSHSLPLLAHPICILSLSVLVSPVGSLSVFHKHNLLYFSLSESIVFNHSIFMWNSYSSVIKIQNEWALLNGIFK